MWPPPSSIMHCHWLTSPYNSQPLIPRPRPPPPQHWRQHAQNVPRTSEQIHKKLSPPQSLLLHIHSRVYRYYIGTGKIILLIFYIFAIFLFVFYQTIIGPSRCTYLIYSIWNKSHLISGKYCQALNDNDLKKICLDILGILQSVLMGSTLVYHI